MMRVRPRSAGRAARRGTVLIAVVLGLVALQLVIVGVAVLGTRGQDLSVRRIESARAFYAAEAAANIAVREVAQSLDDDGDATLGSLALGNPATGVSIGGARAAASVTVAGNDYTIRVTGQSGDAAHGHVVNLRRTAASAVPGLYAEYYRLSIGPSAVASVPWSSTPNWVGIVPNVNMPNLSSAARWPSGPTGRYGIRMRGKITIPTTGTWTFSTNSDDGSTLSINGTLVVNNDGQHSAITRAGSIVLPAGEADFDVKFFENGGSSNVTAFWSGPGIATTVIPPSAFTCTPLRSIAPLLGSTSLSIVGAYGTTIDGFNSAMGAYGGSNILTSGFAAATNSTTAGALRVTATTMAANALAGVGGVPANVIQTTSGGVITGTQSAATAGVGVSYQGIPANVPAAATTLSLTTSQTLSSNARYSTMSLSGSAALNISGDVTIYCVGNLSMANAAAINLLPGASLVLFVAGNVTMSNTATFNFNTGDPRRVRVYFTTAPRSMTMSNDSRFCGQAFNPGGGLTLSGSAFETPRYLGVFHGTTISTSSFTNIHADAAYGASSVSGSATTTILEWRQDR